MDQMSLILLWGWNLHQGLTLALLMSIPTLALFSFTNFIYPTNFRGGHTVGVLPILFCGTSLWKWELFASLWGYTAASIFTAAEIKLHSSLAACCREKKQCQPFDIQKSKSPCSYESSTSVLFLFSLGPRKQSNACMKQSLAGLHVQNGEFSHEVMFFFFVFLQWSTLLLEEALL